MKAFLKYILLRWMLPALGGLAFGIFLGYMEMKQFERGRQAEYEYVIKQIESTNNLYPYIIFSGEYSAIRHEKPYEACVEICKIREQGK